MNFNIQEPKISYLIKAIVTALGSSIVAGATLTLLFCHDVAFCIYSYCLALIELFSFSFLL